MLNVNVINAKNTQKVEVKPGQPANLKVDPNTRFELVDSASGKAPAQIKARRVGDNLEIVTDEKAQIEDETVSNAQKPDLVLENYYKQADVSLFAGAGQEAVSYVPVDGAASGSYAAMNTSATTGAALGVLPLLNPLLGAAVFGAGAVVATNANGSTTATNQLPVAQDAVTKVTENKIVSDKVPTATDADGTVASYRLVSDVAAGKLTFNADGSYSFEANKDFDSLADGQTRTVSFTYSAVDNAGGVSAPKTVTITVTGVNDAPVAIAAAKVVDEGSGVNSGAVTASDADVGATLKYKMVGNFSVLSAEGPPAGLSFNADGSYTFDANNVAYDSLNAGETKDVVVKFKANDGTLDSAEQTLKVTVKGTNDAPVISSSTQAATVTEDGNGTTTFQTVSGQVTASDVDHDAVLSYSANKLAGEHGALTLNTSTGAWSYTLTNDQTLSASDSLTDTFTVTVSDGKGGSDTQVVTITVKGTNDAPVISSSTQAATVTEDGNGTTTFQTVSGQVTASDVDHDTVLSYSANKLAGEHGALTLNTSTGAWSYTLTNDQTLSASDSLTDTFTVTVTDDKGATTSQAVTITVKGTNDAPQIFLTEGDADQADLLETNVILSTSGTLTVADPDAGDVCSAHVADVNFDGSTAFDPTVLSAVDLSNLKAFVFNWLSVSEINDPSTSHNLSWSFNSIKNSYLDWLEAGEKLVLNYIIEVQDTSGEKVSEVVSVTIEGSDDVPEISIVGTDADSADVREDPLHVDATGTISVNYGDLLESAQLVVSGVEVNLAKSQLPVPLTADEVTALEAALLGKLQLLADSTTPDGLHNVQWSLDLGGLLPKGAILVLDYTLDLKNFDNTFAFDQQVISISITGENDAPVIQLTGSDSDQVVLTESNQILSASGTLTVTDPDYNDSIVSFEVIDVQLDPTVPSFLTTEQFASVQTAFKSFLTLSAVGTMADLHNLEWTFDSAYDDNLDLIPEGAALSLKYTIEVKDTAGTTTSHAVTVKIDGTNDGPAIQVQSDDTDRADLTETNSALSASGTVSLFDMDLTDEVNYVISDVALNTTVTSFLSADDFAIIKEQVKGFMTLEAIGYLNDGNNLQWTFDSTGDSHSGFIPAGQTLALDYTVTATDKSGETATHVIHINILGTNATPLIEFKGSDSASESLIETDNVLSTTGTMSLTDLDFNDPANATRISVKVTGFDGGFDTNHFLGMLKLSTETDQNGDPLRVNEPHNVRWTFESLANEDFDYLAKDEVLKLEYTIEVKDSLGATSQQVVAVSITGTNDAPQVYVWDGDSASGSILSPTQDVTGSLSIFDEDVVNAYFAGVKFDGVQITDAALKSSLYSLLVMDPTSTFQTVNEPNNYDWRFKTADALAKGLTTGLSAGEHQLTYTMDFVDTYSAEHKQDINILFTV